MRFHVLALIVTLATVASAAPMSQYNKRFRQYYQPYYQPSYAGFYPGQHDYGYSPYYGAAVASPYYNYRQFGFNFPNFGFQGLRFPNPFRPTSGLKRPIAPLEPEVQKPTIVVVEQKPLAEPEAPVIVQAVPAAAAAAVAEDDAFGNVGVAQAQFTDVAEAGAPAPVAFMPVMVQAEPIAEEEIAPVQLLSPKSLLPSPMKFLQSLLPLPSSKSSLPSPMKLCQSLPPLPKK